MQVNAPCTCNGLEVWFGWKAWGKGNPAEGMVGRSILFRGMWMPGMDNRYSFEFRVPPGPVTYHGKLLNVDWLLRARADIPWAIDPKVETALFVEAGKGEGYDFGPRFEPPEVVYRRSEKQFWLVLFIFGSIAAAGLGLVISVGARELPSALIGGLFLIVGGVMVLHLLWRRISERRLGVPQVRIGASVVQGGQMVPVSVRIRPRALLRLGEVTVELRGQEEVVSGSGKHRKVYRHVFHQSREVLNPGGRDLLPGEEAVFGGGVEFPADAPPTFAAPDNALRWDITLRIAVGGWPDWKQVYPVAVRPRAKE